MTIPNQVEIEAAWHSLSPEIRNRIGIIATDMVFQAFVYGDGYAPRDRALPGRSKAVNAIRGSADDACCARLTELHRVVEDVLPDLFGPAGENPEWAVAMGAKR